MNVVNAVFSEPSQAKNFFEKLNPNEPFVMVNLLKFKKNAQYADGRETNLSGAEAYQLYLDEVKDLVQDLGGQLLNNSGIFGLLIGEVEELWDRIVLVKYPSKEVFMKITQSKPFEEAGKHRLAGLAGQLNIGTKVSM